MSNRFKFSWDLLGDIDLGRPNLGRDVKIEVYRLMQFTIREVLEEEYGTEKSDEIFFEAGKKAGKAFYKHFLYDCKDVKECIKKMYDSLKDLKIGIMRVESMTSDASKLVLSIDEDADCSGLPEIDFGICVYDEGFFSGILETFTGSEYTVKEIDCWCTGERTCRFSAEKKE